MLVMMPELVRTFLIRSSMAMQSWCRSYESSTVTDSLLNLLSLILRFDTFKDWSCSEWHLCSKGRNLRKSSATSLIISGAHTLDLLMWWLLLLRLFQHLLLLVMLENKAWLLLLDEWYFVCNCRCFKRWGSSSIFATNQKGWSTTSFSDMVGVVTTLRFFSKIFIVGKRFLIL